VEGEGNSLVPWMLKEINRLRGKGFSNHRGFFLVPRLLWTFSSFSWPTLLKVCSIWVAFKVHSGFWILNGNFILIANPALSHYMNFITPVLLIPHSIELKKKTKLRMWLLWVWTLKEKYHSSLTCRHNAYELIHLIVFSHSSTAPPNGKRYEQQLCSSSHGWRNPKVVFPICANLLPCNRKMDIVPSPWQSYAILQISCQQIFQNKANIHIPVSQLLLVKRKYITMSFTNGLNFGTVKSFLVLVCL
jgi:hypothetical protein